MNCPDIEKIAPDELDEPVRAHLLTCAPCRERREKLARLLAFPAAEAPPADVLPRLLARIDEKIAREVARPARFAGQRRFVAAVFAFALIGSSLVLVLSDGDTRARERRLETLVVESEWRALGYASEREFHADSDHGGTK
jgi:predicted anti-sigma-YlaC factor YlaD